ncbi:Phosphoglycerate mutase, 2,3-bisphosphoglycerate-independent [Melia azedarach]|uniref:Phosphoglycerate mutase, 2,3-bisphosphoglycerate-independent n=1 Tax=Melia azedarach TaxID=155640 RepID=A0ACC1WYE9_MELAZ|nr:Phosphoglycerate mutase, 2,3-bisphosphoglycerate-independent [Melia azedarach]
MDTAAWKLQEHPSFSRNNIVAVVVLDGWGEFKPDKYNCIHVAETPTMDSFKESAPKRWRLIKAHGTAVGLPTEDDMGNSEVGHNALGAGRIYAQGAKLVDLALASGKIYDGEGFKYIQQSFETGTLHLIGLLSDGGVHSRLDQIQLLLKGAAEHGAKRIRVHVLTDGRDVLDGSSVGFVETLEKDLAELRVKGIDAQIASGGGRMYVTMDRYENDWDVVKRGWDAQVLGEAPHKFRSAVEAVKKLREEPKANDQYLPPFVIVDENGKAILTNLIGFDSLKSVMLECFNMTGELKLPSHYLVSPPEIERTSGEYLVHNGVRTFACSETVKFGHVTFFWNGNRSGYFDPKMEEYVEIPSDVGITFNVQPKMKALEIAERAKKAILSRRFHQVRVNLPNGDMVGHTGDIEATVVACKAADEAVKIIIDAIEQRNKSGEPAVGKDGKVQILTSHTLQPVPIAIGGPGLPSNIRFRSDLPGGGLANVAATFMNLHGYVAPSDYEPSLLEAFNEYADSEEEM